MDEFIIKHNETGYHIYQAPFWYNKEKYEPLVQTCSSYEKAIKWLEKNYPDYKIIET